jgi:4-hydroxythreonine-4-phosphate dehydrogenase
LPNPSAKSRSRASKVIAVTLGDPQGIGPEVIAKSIASFSPAGSLVIVGARRYFPPARIRVINDVRQVRAGETAFLEVEHVPAGEDLSFAWVKAASKMAMRGEVAALVTAPVNKDKWLASGLPFRGHTDFFASLVPASPLAMFFWSPGLKVALFTHHIPLRAVFTGMNRGRIAAFVRLVDEQLRRLFAREFTYLLSGLNPHAGENGHLGKEETDVIAPAMNDLQGRMPIAGIYPPDVVFAKARSMKNAVVIAWTHDQGLIPFKLLQARNGVQLTLGLPFVRTSPVHGTAYDIAGQGIADPASMMAAIRLAATLPR